MAEKNWILTYWKAIQDGSVTVSKWIWLVVKYVVDGLESKKFYFDPKKANRAVEFIENFCHHSKGREDLLKLELWQKAIISVLFGVVDCQGYRQFWEIIIIIGKKNGKSLLAAAIIAYVIFCDGEYGAEIYCVAPKLDQAEIVYSCFWQSVRHESALAKRIKPRKSDYYVEKTNSFVKKIPFNEKKAEGLNPHLTVCDEIASWPGKKGLLQYDTLATAPAARRQPILLSISTSGYENEGIYDQLINRCTRLLMGDSREARLIAFLYMIDDPAKWDDLEELKKSNPNYGVSVSREYMENAIAVAHTSPTKKAEFMVKHCNVKQNASQAWLASDDVNKNFRQTLRLEDFSGCYCVGGIDLSRTTDLTACCALIEKNGVLYGFFQFFLPGDRIQEASDRDNLPYAAYVQRGILTPSGKNFVDYHDCFNWFRELIEKYKIYPLKIGYDRYCAQYLVQDLQTYGFHMDDVYQGFNLSPVIRETEGLMRDGAFELGDNDLLKIHLLDMAMKTDLETGKCRAVKLATGVHIDGGVTLLDAMTVRQKWYAEIGGQLKNESH